jgi:hypothetical protein
MTIKEANRFLQRELSKIYSGIDGNDSSTQVKLTLGNIRTIQINIMGEVELAGTYMLSAFSTVIVQEQKYKKVPLHIWSFSHQWFQFVQASLGKC